MVRGLLTTLFEVVGVFTPLPNPTAQLHSVATWYVLRTNIHTYTQPLISASRSTSTHRLKSFCTEAEEPR